MAEVEVKLYGELHLDSNIKSTTVNAENVSGIFDELNRQIFIGLVDVLQYCQS